MLESNHTE